MAFSFVHRVAVEMQIEPPREGVEVPSVEVLEMRLGNVLGE